MKIDGLRTIQALAQHHPEVLNAKLHEVCVVIIEEVLYTLSSVQPCLFLIQFHLLTSVYERECCSLD